MAARKEGVGGDGEVGGGEVGDEEAATSAVEEEEEEEEEEEDARGKNRNWRADGAPVAAAPSLCANC